MLAYLVVGVIVAPRSWWLAGGYAIWAIANTVALTARTAANEVRQEQDDDDANDYGKQRDRAKNTVPVA
jgi:acetoin utilization deacetylase AcuC-like enzyme